MKSASIDRFLRRPSDAGAIAQSSISIIVAVFFVYLIYVGVTEEGMRNWIVAMYWVVVMKRTVVVLVVSAIATLGLWRRWRWAWFASLALDGAVVAMCTYEIGWGEWSMWADGRLFSNREDVICASLFIAGAVFLLRPSVVRAALGRDRPLVSDCSREVG
jgi:hypothetical protein